MKALLSLYGLKTRSLLAGVVLCLACMSSRAQVLITAVTRLDDQVYCSWSGGGDLFQVQRRTGLDFGAWTDLRGGLITGRSTMVGSEHGQAFFRVVDLSTGQATVFEGGSVEELRALNPELTFDHLIITGHLTLDLNTTVLLRVNHFTLLSGASIGYSYGDCDYGAAPSLTIEATGQVNLGGEIRLNGRGGTRVTSSATCNSCTGQDAGSLQILARDVRVSGVVETYGGAGSTSVSEFGSSGCSGGDGGLIRIQAESIRISQAWLETRAGNGGTGFMGGDPNYGADGQAGELQLSASSYLQIKESELNVDGIAQLDAPQASISSPVVAGDPRISIGGETDGTAPHLEFLYPWPNMTLPIDQSLTVVIYAEDSGSGVKEVHLSGLGLDETYPANELIDDRLTVVIQRPEPPGVLIVTAIDNLNYHSSQTVSGLWLSGDLIIPSGSTYFLSEDLDLGAAANVVIEGNLEIPRSGTVRIHAGSLTLSSSGLITSGEPTEDLELAESPTLILDIVRDVSLEGVVDLKGHSSMAGRDYDYAQGGGQLTVAAEHIHVPGSVLLAGGQGLAYAYGWPAQYIRQGGGPGGILRLEARNSVSVSGSLSVEGGDTGSGALGPCFDGGAAGRILITYGEQAGLGGVQELLLTGGNTLCSSVLGDDGVLATMKRVAQPVPQEEFLVQEEVEPNGDPATAVRLEFPLKVVTDVLFAFAPLEIAGTVADPDLGGLQFTHGDESYQISDLYRLSIPVEVAIDLELECPSGADLELAVFHADTYEIVGSSLSDANPEVLSKLGLSPGDYLVGVWALERGSTPIPSYHLRVIPVEFP